MQTVAPFGTASGNSKQDWRNSDAYRQWKPTGMGFQKITQSSDGQTFGDTGEARAYDAWRASQPQAIQRSQGGPYGYYPGGRQWDVPASGGQRASLPDDWVDRNPGATLRTADISYWVNPETGEYRIGGGGVGPTKGSKWVKADPREYYEKLMSSARSAPPRYQPYTAPPASQRPATPSNQEFTRGWNDSMAQYANIPGVRITPAVSYGGEGLGNLAYAQSRPEAFQQSMRGFGSQMSPNDFVAQRDAFIQRLNDERGKLSAQAGVYGNNDKPNFYRPSRDFGALWRQAGDMVKDGWKNPLAGLFG